MKLFYLLVTLSIFSPHCQAMTPEGSFYIYCNGTAQRGCFCNGNCELRPRYLNDAIDYTAPEITPEIRKKAGTLALLNIAPDFNIDTLTAPKNPTIDVKQHTFHIHTCKCPFCYK